MRKDQNLDVIDAKKNSIYKHTFIFKEVEQDQVLTKVDEPEDKQFEEISSIFFFDTEQKQSRKPKNNQNTKKKHPKHCD